LREHLSERTFAGQELWRLAGALLALVAGFLAGRILRRSSCGGADVGVSMNRKGKELPALGRKLLVFGGRAVG